jgi:hypothetical protein
MIIGPTRIKPSQLLQFSERAFSLLCSCMGTFWEAATAQPISRANIDDEVAASLCHPPAFVLVGNHHTSPLSD